MERHSRSRRHKRHHRASSSSDSYSRSRSVSSDWSTSSDRHRRHKKKKAHKRRPSSDSRNHKRRRHSSGPRHKDRARALPSSSDRDDNLSISVDNNEFEGASRAGSPHKASSKLARKHLIDKGSSDSEEEEEVTISFAEAIQEVVSLLPPEFCPRKESSETLQRPRSTLDALNPSEDKSSASLPQSLLIKDVVNVFQSLIDKKVKLEPGWVTNKSLEKDLGINMKHYRSHGQLFHDSVPKLDRDASLLDLTSSGNVSLPLKSLETIERQARNMVSINSYADLFTAASVETLQSDNLDAPMLKRLLSSIVTCLKHSSSMSVVLAVELLQARREAAIDKSKILTETKKSKLRSVPISAESLFGGKIAELQKLNSDSQQQSFIASSVIRHPLLALRFLNAKRSLKTGIHLPLLDLRFVGIEVVLGEVLVVEAQVLEEGVSTPPPEEVPPTFLDNDVLPPLSLPRKDLPVGGRLAHFQNGWGEITEDSWVLSVVRKGYKIPFICKPLLSPTPIFLSRPKVCHWKKRSTNSYSKGQWRR